MTEMNTIDELADCHSSSKLLLTIMDSNVTLDDASLKDIQLSYKNAECVESMMATVFEVELIYISLENKVSTLCI